MDSAPTPASPDPRATPEAAARGLRRALPKTPSRTVRRRTSSTARPAAPPIPSPAERRTALAQRGTA